MSDFSTESPEDRLALRAGQLSLHCRQALRVPVAGVLVSLFVVHLLWEHHPRPGLVAWALALCLVLLARAAVAWWLLRRPPAGPAIERWAGVMAGFNLTSGIVGAASAPLFLPGAPLPEQALLTTVLCCWCAGSISTSSSLPLAFYGFVLPFMSQIIVAWTMTGTAGGLYIAGLMAVFAAYVLLFGRDNSTQVADSLRIRRRNAGLIEDLRREREEANAARERAESASRSKSRFIAAASHDLRQPLHALSLYSAALSQSGLEPRTAGIARNIEAAVDSLDTLFEALLDLSRLDAGVVVAEKRPLALHALFERLRNEFRPQAEAKGLDLSCETTARVLLTDPLLLERILRNLLDNAVRYTSRGGVRMTSDTAGDGLEISVADSGIGIPATEQERIFEEFYQVDNFARDPSKGLGLGLASVQRLADLLGFRIRLRSSPGAGSAFILGLPASALLAEADCAPPAPAHRVTPLDLRGRTVLVIEDDLRAQHAMSTLVAQWGCRPIVACSGEEALHKLAGEPRRPDVVLADYRLGDGHTGVQAIRALEREMGDMAAILVTGDTDPEHLRTARESGIPLLHKPVKEAQLRAAIEAVFSPAAAT
jgi:signal transduction histidine kinase/CheY-like chemotaxis protein